MAWIGLNYRVQLASNDKNSSPVSSCLGHASQICTQTASFGHVCVHPSHRHYASMIGMLAWSYSARSLLKACATWAHVCASWLQTPYERDRDARMATNNAALQRILAGGDVLSPATPAPLADRKSGAAAASTGGQLSPSGSPDAARDLPDRVSPAAAEAATVAAEVGGQVVLSGGAEGAASGLAVEEVADGVLGGGAARVKSAAAEKRAGGLKAAAEEAASGGAGASCWSKASTGTSANKAGGSKRKGTGQAGAEAGKGGGKKQRVLPGQGG